MIASVASRTVSAGRAACHAGLAPRAPASARPERQASAIEDRPAREHAGQPRATRRAAGPEDILCDDAPLSSPALATAAARAFSAGNGYLPGLIVDRFA